MVQDLAGDALRYADAQACICALRETLLAAALECGAPDLARHCVEAISRSMPDSDFAPIFELSRPALRAMKAQVMVVVRRLQTRPAANIEHLLVTAILILSELPDRVLATDIIERSSRVTPLEEEAIAFFTSKYAPNQSVGAQERWEYLAVRLCHGLPGNAGAAYRDLLERATALAAPEQELSTAHLYQQVLALPGLSDP